MSAETLRRAASLMRERAERSKTAFGYGPWKVDGLDEYGHYVIVPTEQIGLGSRVAADLTEDDAEHVASWHPALALVVADWLDTAGADLWAHGPLCECGSGCHDCDDDLWQPHVRRALAVARIYLGVSA